MAVPFYEHRIAADDERRPALPSLTGMRGIAAVAVFFFHIMVQADDLPYSVDILHIFQHAELRENYRFVFGSIGHTAVSFFFVLSGFILTWSARPGTQGRFWRRRFVKIYPLHLVTYPLGALLLTGPITSAADLPGLFLVQSWIPDYRFIFGANGPSWSISAELFFYLMFPVLLCWFRRVPEDRLRWLMAALVAGVAAVAVVSHLTLPFAGQVWVGYVFPPVRLLEFAMGIVLARLVTAGRWWNVSLSAATALLGLASVAALFVPKPYAFAAVTIVPVLLVIAAGAQADVSARKSLLRGRTMVWLGEVSFAFYLVHLSVLMGMRRLLGQDQSWDLGGAALFVLACAAITLALAWLLHVYVEKPAMRRWG